MGPVGTTQGSRHLLSTELLSGMAVKCHCLKQEKTAWSHFMGLGRIGGQEERYGKPGGSVESKHLEAADGC